MSQGISVFSVLKNTKIFITAYSITQNTNKNVFCYTISKLVGNS